MRTASTDEKQIPK